MSIVKVRAGSNVLVVVVIAVVVVIVVDISGHWEKGLSISVQARNPIAPQPVLPLLTRSAPNRCSSRLGTRDKRKKKEEVEEEEEEEEEEEKEKEEEEEDGEYSYKAIIIKYKAYPT
ncbi:hypothetical protein M0802_014526 [Mischocyttarus mexicanus]|nr:hypothetical protein M0802_014526 [Mischocyttarus mexicanus]